MVVGKCLHTERILHVASFGLYNRRKMNAYGKEADRRTDISKKGKKNPDDFTETVLVIRRQYNSMIFFAEKFL